MDFTFLAETTPDVLEKIKVAEREGRFSDHLDPIAYDECAPVDENFPYIPGPLLKLKYLWLKLTFLNPFTENLCRKIFKAEITGQENLKGIKGAVYTCNHINKCDGLVMIWALKHSGNRRLQIMTADFNNRKDALGELMRADGIMPFKNTRGVIKAFGNAVSYYLKKGTGVLFFPEGSEWWCYEKPRPFMDGAFHYAVENNVPVVPAFITFTKTGEYFSNGIEKRKFTVHFLKPVFPDPALSKKENVKMMKQKDFDECMEKYNEWYGNR